MSIIARLKQERKVLITNSYGREEWVPARSYQRNAVLQFIDEVEGLRRELSSKDDFSFERYQFSELPLVKHFEIAPDLGGGQFWIGETVPDDHFNLRLIREDGTQLSISVHHYPRNKYYSYENSLLYQAIVYDYLEVKQRFSLIRKCLKMTI
jgi:hypothetical protein